MNPTHVLLPASTTAVPAGLSPQFTTSAARYDFVFTTKSTGANCTADAPTAPDKHASAKTDYRYQSPQH